MRVAALSPTLLLHQAEAYLDASFARGCLFDEKYFNGAEEWDGRGRWKGEEWERGRKREKKWWWWWWW
jgi:hypothetical protein